MRVKEGWEDKQSVLPPVFVAFVMCRDSHPTPTPTCALDPGRIDPYGFERPHDYDSYKDMMDEYVVILNRRSRRWSKLLQEKPQMEKNVTGREGLAPPAVDALYLSGVLSWGEKNVFFVK